MIADIPNACHCGTCATCAGSAPRPAVADPLAYRHGAIKARMLESIATVDVRGRRPLEALTTREDDDPAIALVDAFAGAMHVLAHNVSRLFDDGSILRTQDRDALVDLSRLLGYEPRPPMAATTTLSFVAAPMSTMTAAPMVPKGAKVASVPGQGEQPQIFETDAPLEVREAWNELKPVLATVPQNPLAKTIAVQGGSLAVKAGDVVAVYPKGSTLPLWNVGRVAKVARKTDPDPSLPEAQRAWTELDVVYESGAVNSATTLKGQDYWENVVVLGERASAFGANAPDKKLLAVSKINVGEPEIVPGGSATSAAVDLDNLHADAVKGALVLFQSVSMPAILGENNVVAVPAQTAAVKLGVVDGVKELGRSDYGLSAKVTRIAVKGVDVSTDFGHNVRGTAIYIQTARGTLLEYDKDEAMPAASSEDRIVVQGKVELPAGRRVVLSGEKWKGADVPGDPASEVAIVKSCEPSGDNTVIVFTRAVNTVFRSKKLVIYGNSVGASHGDSPQGDLPELLGSTDATALLPRYALKRAPLTYVPSPDARGYAPALEVRVGERRYDEATTLFGRAAADRVYAVKRLRDGGSEIRFAGRLPTGTNNVTALYRVGAGLAGNLARGRITTVMSPVLGVSQVRHPVPAEGGSDAETLEDLRVQAPQSIRTLDRVVSLRDYEAFARNRRGIGKALATELDAGMRSRVCLTIATTALESPTPGSDIMESLRDALRAVSPPGRAVLILGFDKTVATIVAALAVDGAYRRADVEGRAREVLVARLGAAGRRFGEALHRGAVLAALQSVEGVLAVRLDTFTAPGAVEDNGRLPCPLPRLDANGDVLKGGLLCVDADSVTFTEMQA